MNRQPPDPSASVSPAPPAHSAGAGFTLVELLVVIGIIALLISILLPALSTVRRQANQAKCAAQIRQLYVGFLLYAGDNKDVWPAGRITLGSTYSFTGKRYSVGSVDFPIDASGSAASKSIYFYDLIAKYLTPAKQGVTAKTAQEAAYARRSVLWACPSWEGFDGTAVGGKNLSQIGIGMNLWPSMTPTNPAAGTNYPATNEESYFMNFGDTTQTGTWYKSVFWARNGANRLLLADSRLYLAESRAMPLTGVYPPQPNINNDNTYNAGVAGQTVIDVYRHGKYPRPNPNVAQTFNAYGGTVAYNILFCDGHVGQQSDARAAYETVRQRFPG